MKASSRSEEASRPDSFHGWVTVLVHRHRARLARVVRREGLRADDALDCVQEAFLSFLTLPQARLLVGLSDDSARMLVILARNIARNRRRRHDYSRPHIVDDAAVESLVSDTVSADDVIAAAEQHAMMLGCITTLNEMQRAVAQLRVADHAGGKRHLATVEALTDRWGGLRRAAIAFHPDRPGFGLRAIGFPGGLPRALALMSARISTGMPGDLSAAWGIV
jgi:RNA polymerase sigma-70 factor (ECF subfamily)